MIGADAGDVHKPLDAGLRVPASRDRAGRIDMDGVEGLAAALDIEADGVHHAPGAHQRRSATDADRGRRRGRPRSGIAGECRLGASRMPGGHAHRKSMRAQATDHMPAEEAGAAEHGDDAVGHLRTQARPSVPLTPLIPAQAGIQSYVALGPRFRGDERMLVSASTQWPGPPFPPWISATSACGVQRRLLDAHVERLQRVLDRIDDRGGGRDGRDLAGALGAERIERRGRLL